MFISAFVLHHLRGALFHSSEGYGDVLSLSIWTAISLAIGIAHRQFSPLWDVNPSSGRSSRGNLLAG
jgi:hypothetical protein